MRLSFVEVQEVSQIVHDALLLSVNKTSADRCQDPRLNNALSGDNEKTSTSSIPFQFRPLFFFGYKFCFNEC